MNNEDFSELILSIRQAGEIRRGEREPSRKTEVAAPDVQRIRARLHLSQVDFATLIGVSPRTVQNWEQKRRRPAGPAFALLRVADKNPKALLDALHG